MYVISFMQLLLYWHENNFMMLISLYMMGGAATWS